MKMGFVSSILGGWSYEEVIDTAAQLGFQCVETACWPEGKAERKYGGVTHINVQELDDEKARHIVEYAAGKGIVNSSLAFYPNTMDGNQEKREANIAHLYKVIDASAKLNINLVTTFIGRDQTKTVDENLELVKEIWPPIIKYAKEKGVKIAIENCPMLFGKDQWPGGQNLMTTPRIWDRIFEILPDDNLGLNYDPSHFVWQMMDYIQPIYDFKDKIFHVHFKDIKVNPVNLNKVGIMAYPLDFMEPKLPGLGDVKWDRFVSALTDIRYDGAACIEVEDRAFEGSREKTVNSLILPKRYLEQFVI